MRTSEAFAVAMVVLCLWSTKEVAVVCGASWCIARSNGGEQALQAALDYACGMGADCAPIQPNGLCYLPNTMQAHASYAMNSYYQRKGNAPGSCDFGGNAVVAMTDPSYGSCVYPSSASTAGGSSVPPPPPGTGTGTSPFFNPPPATGGTGTGIGGGGIGGGGLNNPAFGPPSDASPPRSSALLYCTSLSLLVLISLLNWI
ncbi:hypothetical protein AMTRI_Chr06g194910 [Amborella trichopoda]|uniref:X8 domain-containing protein n=1 Tax=Amborella trichopoda TaxID=13333 RepID=W1PPP9_AMBTC|nr:PLASMODESMATA CALLOSE-BINDING PROTEIN 3 [Amborella trichopoda]ERN10048.1 hypothetical protein AMTR_s00013p00250830 [Amborella trichopoda]|eukprot:XP_006848467.1 PLASMODESMATA CALLOSE-BINDING PROTEIN 3 [Amborella trichopoda]